MRRPLFVVLLTSLLSAGCLAPDGDDGSDAADDLPSVTMRASEAVELGRLTVNTPVPGPHTFAVDVPAGGAQDVRWQLTIAGPAALTSAVAGHGCIGGGANVNVVVGIGATSTRGGSCDDLSAGEATFTVNITDAATAFTAVIFGTVTTTDAAATA